MSKTGRRDGYPQAVYIIAGLLAAIAGFGTIYWNLAPSGNDSMATQSTEAQSGDGAGAEAKGPLAGLNTGEMAGVLLRSPPQDVPDLPIETDGPGPKSVAAFKGKVVLLNIWATWCHPCREEMPALNRLQAKLGGKDFAVVALNIDRGGLDGPKKFLAEVGADHLGLYHDPTGKAFAKLHVVGMPTTLLLNRQGQEIGRLIGPAKWDSPDAVRLIQAAIAEGQPAAGGDAGAPPPTQTN
jgi:thiol-disulfide isomerase/thioredoxin